jgi:hypothetical protein
VGEELKLKKLWEKLFVKETINITFNIFLFLILKIYSWNLPHNGAEWKNVNVLLENLWILSEKMFLNEIFYLTHTQCRHLFCETNYQTQLAFVAWLLLLLPLIVMRLMKEALENESVSMRDKTLVRDSVSHTHSILLFSSYLWVTHAGCVADIIYILFLWTERHSNFSRLSKWHQKDYFLRLLRTNEFNLFTFHISLSLSLSDWLSWRSIAIARLSQHLAHTTIKQHRRSEWNDEWRWRFHSISPCILRDRFAM